MTPERTEWHLALPVGRRRDTGEPMTLSDALREPDALASPTELSYEDRVEVVVERWSRGEWTDTYYGTDGLVDLPRAIAEARAGSDLGRALVETTERSAALALRHLRDTLPGGA